MEDLVLKAKNGDSKAKQELFDLVYSDLYKIAISILRNSANAEDIVQDTCLTALECFHTLKNNSSFKPWITKILKNKCYTFLKNRKNKLENIEDYPMPYDTISHVDASINFKAMVEKLDPEEKEIFILKYEDGLTISQISKRLNKTESAIKSVLCRGRQKLSTKIKKPMLVFILCMLVVGAVIGACMYITSLFETSSVGINNDGMLYAIDNLDWYQRIDMDYIEVDNDSKIKLSYISMDEMSLYMIFDFHSEKDISKFNNITFSDLKIVDDNNLLICDTLDHTAKQYNIYVGFKPISNDGHNMKFLLYMYNDSFPKSRTLDISFSNLVLAKQTRQRDFLNTNINFEIELDEKFLNRSPTLYNSSDFKFEKTGITETGFYSIVNLDNTAEITALEFIDSNGISYPCFFTNSHYNADGEFKYIITSPFYDKSAENLTLIINGKEYFLTKN